MSKLAIILVLFSTTTLVWHQTEAKPFLFLPPKFFVLTTRAPSTDSSASATSYSSSSASLETGGLFQLKTDIISRKLSLISSLLSGFGGSIGGSFGLGFKFNSVGGTRNPTTTTTTTEPNVIFTPDVTTKSPAITTKAPIATTKTSVITEKAPDSSTTAETILTTDTTAVNLQSIADAKAPTISATTTGDLEIEVSTTERPKDDSAGAVGANFGSSTFEVLSVGGKEDIQNAETVTDAVVSVGVDAALGSVGGVVPVGAGVGGYGYETTPPDTDNEILNSNVSRMYLPPL
ncbi:PREDICTED: cell wall integrity and stress response component 4-like [Rhagoletis zephyria]|uniref:cell wall integrity and stress response component 4-like n=1 Tax=Rhagoletis zephyria TaxID=28612 RepID=UPI000811953B|nr:PREDICTED: cell wall integrity and stress response component 4-like [Rhagoletis zephyria]XP_017493795.1 PREDICTED: cell wall integrity and stress response component 4-like [Rhagoletis zephyria]